MQTSITSVGFKPIIPVFKQSQTASLRPNGHCYHCKTLKWLYSNRFPYQNPVCIPCFIQDTCIDNRTLILGFSVGMLIFTNNMVHCFEVPQITHLSTLYSFIHVFQSALFPNTCIVCCWTVFRCLPVFEKLYVEKSLSVQKNLLPQLGNFQKGHQTITASYFSFLYSCLTNRDNLLLVMMPTTSAFYIIINYQHKAE